MAKLKDILSEDSSQATTQLNMLPGSVLLGPMQNVDHEKFYIIAGVNQERVFVCCVIINSEINQFILKRTHLLERQLELCPNKYRFLSHKSYINCAQPIKGLSQSFQNASFKRVGTLDDDDLKAVQDEIKNSGMLTEEEIQEFFM